MKNKRFFAAEVLRWNAASFWAAADCAAPVQRVGLGRLQGGSPRDTQATANEKLRKASTVEPRMMRAMRPLSAP